MEQGEDRSDQANGQVERFGRRGMWFREASKSTTTAGSCQEKKSLESASQTMEIRLKQNLSVMKEGRGLRKMCVISEMQLR